MKVVLTISHLIKTTGGAQRSFTELANELRLRGHEITVFYSEKQVPSSARPSFPLDESIPVINLYPENYPASTSKSAEMIKRVYSDRDDLYDEFEWHEEHDPLMQRFLDNITTIEPDIVVSFLPNSFNFISQALISTGIPCVVANRNDPYHDYTIKRYSRNKYDVALRNKAPEIAAANLVQIEEYREFFSDHVKEKTYIIPNPVTPALEQNIAHPETETETNIIISAGRLEDAKNFRLLIDSFSKISSKYPNWIVRIYGEGKLMGPLRQHVEKTGVENKVFLMGVTRDIFKAFAGSSIFVLPSYLEGFSRALTEAMAHGLPSVVLKKCTSNKRLISESGGGLTVDDNPEDFSSAMELLIMRPDMRKEMGSRAIQYVMKFDPRVVYDMWEDLLRKIVKGTSDKDSREKPVSNKHHNIAQRSLQLSQERNARLELHYERIRQYCLQLEDQIIDNRKKIEHLENTKKRLQENSKKIYSGVPFQIMGVLWSSLLTFFNTIRILHTNKNNDDQSQ